MLQPPGSSANRQARGGPRRKTVVSADDMVRTLSKKPPNKKCCDCGTKLPNSVNLAIPCFICMTCAGVHRELIGAKVKGIQASLFSDAEAAILASTDNDQINAAYLARYSPSTERLRRPVDNSDQQLLRAWILRKYKDKAWYSGGENNGVQPSGSGGGNQRAGGGVAGSMREPTVAHIPPRNPPKQQQPVDLFGGFDAPSPNPPPQQSWDAFGGSSANQAPPQKTDEFPADFGSSQIKQQQQSFPAPANSQNNNFGNFHANVPTGNQQQQQQHQQQQHQQQQQFGNFGSMNQDPSNASFRQPTGIGGYPQQQFSTQQQPPPGPSPQQQFGSFPQQQQQQQFGSFPSQQPTPQQSPQQQPVHQQQQPQFGAFPAQQQNQFGSFPSQPPANQLSGPPQNTGNVPEQQVGNFPHGGSQPGAAPTSANTSFMAQPPANGIAQMNGGMQPQGNGMPQSNGMPQQNGGMPQQNGGMPQQVNGGNSPQGVGMPQMNGGMPQQGMPPSQHGGMQPQGGGMLQQGGSGMPQQVMPQQQGVGMPQTNGGMPQQIMPPQQGVSMPPQNSGMPPQGGATPPANGGMSLQQGGMPQSSGGIQQTSPDKFDAFNSLQAPSTDEGIPDEGTPRSTLPTPDAAPPASSVGSKSDKKQLSKFQTGQKVFYKSANYIGPAEILKVHLDDDLHPFYTISVQGKEKQTDDGHLSEHFPIRDEVQRKLGDLSEVQLQQVLEFISKLTVSGAQSTLPALSAPVGFSSTTPTSAVSMFPPSNQSSSTPIPGSAAASVVSVVSEPKAPMSSTASLASDPTMTPQPQLYSQGEPRSSSPQQPNATGMQQGGGFGGIPSPVGGGGFKMGSKEPPAAPSLQTHPAPSQMVPNAGSQWTSSQEHMKSSHQPQQLQQQQLSYGQQQNQAGSPGNQTQEFNNQQHPQKNPQMMPGQMMQPQQFGQMQPSVPVQQQYPGQAMPNQHFPGQQMQQQPMAGQSFGGGQMMQGQPMPNQQSAQSAQGQPGHQMQGLPVQQMQNPGTMPQQHQMNPQMFQQQQQQAPPQQLAPTSPQGNPFDFY